MNLLSPAVRALLTAAQLRAIPNTRYDAAKYMQAYSRTYYFAALSAQRRENIAGYIANMNKSAIFDREFKRLMSVAPIPPNLSAGPSVMLPTLPIPVPTTPPDAPVVQAVVTPKEDVPATPNTTAPAVPADTQAAAVAIVEEATTPWWKTPTGIAGGAIAAYVGYRVARNRGWV